MRLFIDVGNTLLKCGKDDGTNVKLLFRLSTKKIEEEMLFELSKYQDIKKIERIYISSVVPNVTKQILRLFPNIDIRVISPLDQGGVTLKIDNPNELGTDLLCDLAGAKNKYGTDLLIIDLGTATKFLFLDKDAVFYSCAITPGIKMALTMMFNNTALLPDTDISKPKHLLDCHNTEDVLSSSAYYSHIAMVNGIVKRYKEEIGHDVRVVLTGGNSFLIKEKLDFQYDLDENLCLNGLKVIADLKEDL